jgi:hypothetical protein
MIPHGRQWFTLPRNTGHLCLSPGQTLEQIDSQSVLPAVSRSLPDGIIQNAVLAVDWNNDEDSCQEVASTF